MKAAYIAVVLLLGLAPFLPLCSPAAEATTTPTELEDPALLQTIRAALPVDGAGFGIAVKHLVSGQSAMVNPDKVFVSASLYKLAVMYEAFRQRQAGTFAISGATRSQLTAMITYSDNNSAWALFGRLGLARINATMRELGMPNTVVADPTTTTARETARLFELIYRGEAVDAASSREMLDLLLAQQINDRLPARLPPGTRVAHKTGNIGSYVHDAGIVYAPHGPYIIVVLTNRAYSWGQSAADIARLSRTVYDYFEASRGVPPPGAAFQPPPLTSSAIPEPTPPSPATLGEAASAAVPADGPFQYFPETGHYVSGPFLTFFRGHGGLEIFGYPLTEAFEENGLKVQYFQRQRMEWWPDNPEPYKVLLTLIGDEVLGPATPPIPQQLIPPPRDGTRRYYSQTGHTVGDGFLRYFDRKGGLDIFGYPTSEPYVDGGVVVQNFQRGRMEWRPDNPEPFAVQLTLLGYQLLERRQVPGEQTDRRAAPAPQ